MKRLAAYILFIALIFAGAFSNDARLAFAAGEFEVLVTSKTAKLYKYQNTSKGDFGEIAAGQRIMVSEFGSSWFYRAVPENNSPEISTAGYIYKRNVQKTITSDSVRVIPRDKDIAIYAGSNAETEQIETRAAGTEFTARKISSGWYRYFKTIAGVKRELFVPTSSLQAVTKAPEVRRGIAQYSYIELRTKPASASPLVVRLVPGKEFNFTSYTSSWMTTTYGGKTCYLPKNQVDVLKTGAARRVVPASHLKPGYSAPTIVPKYTKYLKYYDEGYSFVVTPYTAKWSQATTTVAGVKQKIYFLNSDYLFGEANAASRYAFVSANPAKAYSRATKNSPVVWGYFPQGSIISVKPFIPGWSTALVQTSSGLKRSFFADDEVKASSNIKISIKTKAYASTLAQHTQANVNLGSALTDLTGTWDVASFDQIKNHLDPNYYSRRTNTALQFMKLNKPAYLPVAEANKLLIGKGILGGQGLAFVDAAKTHNINEIYLISHACLETGNGTSSLAQGGWWSAKLEQAFKTEAEARAAAAAAKVAYDGVKVYNMFGYGAYDSNPFFGGVKTAFEQGWTTPYKAIVGGAAQVGKYYLLPRPLTLSGQDTLYKMRWHPEYTDVYGAPTHQYASDIGWAVKQARIMRGMYVQLDAFTMELEIPRYAQ